MDWKKKIVSTFNHSCFNINRLFADSNTTCGEEGQDQDIAGEPDDVNPKPRKRAKISNSEKRHREKLERFDTFNELFLSMIDKM